MSEEVESVWVWGLSGCGLESVLEVGSFFPQCFLFLNSSEAQRNYLLDKPIFQIH
jgi:hypothetical protein